jgi:hypothetical protein
MKEIAEAIILSADVKDNTRVPRIS